LSGTREVVRTSTNPFEPVINAEVHVPKEIMTTGLSTDSFDPEQHCSWKNEDGSDITRDVDVLVWWRDVGQDRFQLNVCLVLLL
jgi:hypothetical protein